MKYILLFYGNEDEWRSLPPDDLGAAVKRVGDWYSDQVREGRILQSGRLAERSSARTVHLGPAGKSGRPVVTDGPFIEAKESVGSYAVVEAESFEDALAVARSWPGGGAVEVRSLSE